MTEFGSTKHMEKENRDRDRDLDQDLDTHRPVDRDPEQISLL